ncbi:MAG: hypothetical protein FJ090_21660, partial [Deltaproteobacteria bacterium]|nr:hypothetical protein [Deltaproteobacteria bacterium]
MAPRLALPLADRALALLPEGRVAQHLRAAARHGTGDQLGHFAMLARHRGGAVLRAWLGVLATGPVDPRPEWVDGLCPRADEDRLLVALARARMGDGEAR